MQKKMLEAISEMISKSEEAEVKCAKLMLDKIIEGMDNVPPKAVVTTLAAAASYTGNALKKEEIEDDKLFIGKDDAGNLKVAKGKIPEGQMVEVDGKKMLLIDAIGKPFKTGRML